METQSDENGDTFKDFVRGQSRRLPEKFTSSMRTYLLSLVMDDWGTITDTRIDDRAVYNKRRVWSSISTRFAERFPGVNKSVQQLKDLWKRHSIQFRKESREEMALGEDNGSGTVPNEVMFQKLLEWLEANPGGDDPEELSSPPDCREDGEEESQPQRKLSRMAEEEVAQVKMEPPVSPASRANTPSAESTGSAEDVTSGSGTLDSCRKSAEILSAADKHYLIQRCFRAYDVIGSARLDSPALRQKRKTWVEICTEYNRKFGRNLGISTVKGVWRRFVKQRKDDLMKTLKLRTKEDVSESALLQDMQLFLSASLKVSDELERQDLPLYKQIKADVEEKPLTTTARAQQHLSPEQIINQLRRLAPAPPPLRAADGGAAVRQLPTTPAEDHDEGLMSEEEEGEDSALDPRDRLGSDVSITVVEPESRSSSREGTATAPLPSRPPPPLAGPGGGAGTASLAPLAAGAAGVSAACLAREKHQLEVQHLRELHQLTVLQAREKHQWEMERARLETEVVALRRDYWRLQLERARAGVGPHPATGE